MKKHQRRTQYKYTLLDRIYEEPQRSLKINSKDELYTVSDKEQGTPWDFPTQQDEQKSTFLLDGFILQWVITCFNTLASRWPNLACHKLLDSNIFVTTKSDVTTELEVVR